MIINLQKNVKEIIFFMKKK